MVDCANATGCIDETRKSASRRWGMVIEARGTERVTVVFAVSRAIKDVAMSELVIATPGVASLPLTVKEELLKSRNERAVRPGAGRGYGTCK